MRNIYFILFVIVLLLISISMMVSQNNFRVTIYPSKIITGQHEISDIEQISFTIENNSLSDIINVQIKPSCSCSIISNITETIHSGKRHNINIDYHFPSSEGNFNDYFILDVKFNENNIKRIKLPIEGNMTKSFDVYPRFIVKEYDPNIGMYIAVFLIESYDDLWSGVKEFRLIDKNESNDTPKITLIEDKGKYIYGYISIANASSTKELIYVGGIEIEAFKNNKKYFISVPYKFYPTQSKINPAILEYTKSSSYHMKLISGPYNKIKNIMCLNKNFEIPFKEVMSFESSKEVETLISFDLNDKMLSQMDDLSIIEIHMLDGKKIQKNLIFR